MKVCSRFIAFINQHIDTCEKKGIPVNEGITNEVNAFWIDFKRHMDLLLNFLRNVSTNPQSGQYLTQKFLLRLDYNSYFTSKGILTSMD